MAFGISMFFTDGPYILVGLCPECRHGLDFQMYTRTILTFPARVSE